MLPWKQTQTEIHLLPKEHVIWDKVRLSFSELPLHHIIESCYRGIMDSISQEMVQTTPLHSEPTCCQKTREERGATTSPSISLLIELLLIVPPFPIWSAFHQFWNHITGLFIYLKRLICLLKNGLVWAGPERPRVRFFRCFGFCFKSPSSFPFLSLLPFRLWNSWH